MKFNVGQIVRHKNGATYKILHACDFAMMRHTDDTAGWLHAYVYQNLNETVFVRQQAEMEDGRFELVEEDKTNGS
jgi:hypothetical protein